MAAAWIVAPSLDALLAQLNALAPGRSRASDGSIGDAAHAARTSNHNPWLVLNGQAYVKQAQVNQVRQISTPAPRGEILDRNGNVLVDNTKELDVEIAPASLPVKLTQLNIDKTPKADRAVYRRLARVVGISPAPTP